MKPRSYTGRRAVVLGGGIAGLGAAAVLARHFDDVQVIELDRYGDQPGVRPHAPQGAHVHILLAKGLSVMSSLIPELGTWMDAMGRPEGDLTHHLRLAHGGKWLPKLRSGIPFRPCTRPEIEHLLRRHVLRLPNLTLLAGHKAEGLLGRSRIHGVRVSRPDSPGSSFDLEADLVVDAMGRASHSARWLEAAGLSPPVSILDAGVLYASCLFEPPADIDDDWMVMGVQTRVPHDPNSGGLMRLGPDRMLCSFIPYGRPRPPRDTGELVAATAQLSMDEVHRLLRASRPLSKVTIFADTRNRWRHYGRLPRFPDGLISIGDAVCSFNPRYGQGMTVAALAAERLDRELTARAGMPAPLDGFSLHFQKALEDVLAMPWRIALMEDRLWASVFSGRAPGLAERLLMKILEHVLGSVLADVDAYIQFVRVAHLIDPPSRMLSSRVLGALFRGGASDRAPVERPRIQGIPQ